MKKIFILLFAGLLLASCGNASTPTNPETNNTVTTVEDKAPIGKTDDGAITYGNGATRIQIFADFQCPACQAHNKSTSLVLDALAEEGKITIEYRQFPLTTIHKNAFADAMAALCAADENKYRQYKEALYNLEEAGRGKNISNAERIQLAKNLGMNEENFSACLNDEKYKSQVESDMKLGADLGVTGTPTYILNGQIWNTGVFIPANGDTAVFQSKMRTFLERYINETSPNVEPVITTDETPVAENDNNIGGVVEVN